MITFSFPLCVAGQVLAYVLAHLVYFSQPFHALPCVGLPQSFSFYLSACFVFLFPVDVFLLAVVGIAGPSYYEYSRRFTLFEMPLPGDHVYALFVSYPYSYEKIYFPAVVLWTAQSFHRRASRSHTPGQFRGECVVGLFS